jgi:hypothetical protein
MQCNVLGALRVLCIVAALVSGTTHSWSQSPEGQTGGSKANSEKKQTPIIEQMAPAQKANPLTTKYNADEGRRSVDERIANYTFWLTIWTGLLALVTAGLVWMAYRQERHIVRTERPYVFFGDLQTEARGAQGYDFKPFFVNTGKTPAIVRGIRLKISESIEPPIPQTAELPFPKLPN